MRRYIYLGLALVSFLILLGCTSTRAPFMNQDLTRETWTQLVVTDPTAWAAKADNWFFEGEPNATEQAMLAAPPSQAVSTINVAVGNFSNIRVEGDFQVQITGSDGENSVTILGPNELTRKVIVKMYGNLLCLSEEKAEIEPCDMRRVIVRIAVNHLNSLINMGCGRIEAIRLTGNHMLIEQRAPGAMYLSGEMTINSVVNSGPGNLTIIGANSPGLTITTSGTGSTNISGQINLRSIVHHGTNDINVIGATSEGLVIDADGGGKIGISGEVNVKDVRARDNVWVLMPSVCGDFTFVYVYDNALVGMMGKVHSFTVYTSQLARFLGRYLCTDTAFVRALDTSHVNIAASTRIFVNTSGNGSVYFFGPPGILSQFPSGNGLALAIYEGEANYCAAPTMRDYKGEGWEKPEPVTRRHRFDKEPVYIEPAPAPMPGPAAPPKATKSEVDFMSSFSGAG